MEDAYRKNLTEGNVWKMLLKFSMPFLFGQLLQAFYSVTDMFIVGQYMGDAGISAVNNSSTMTMFITFLISGFALSGTVLVAQYVGAGQEENAKKTIGTIFTIFFYASIVITLGGLLLTDVLLNVLNVPAEAYAEAENYMRICFMGTIFISGYNAVSGVLRGLGDSKRPMYFVIIATVINIILDVLFVGKFNMGAGGAALATIMAQGIAFALAVLLLYKQKFIFDFKIKSFKIDRGKVPLIIRIGIPAAVQTTVVNFSILFIISLINSYGLDASTAVGIGGKMDSFALLPSVALSQSVASMAGQNLGARKIDRAKQTLFAGACISFCISLVVFILARTFSYELIGAFGCSESAREIGVMYINNVSIAYLSNSIVFVFSGFATGSGNSVFALLNAATNTIFARITLVLIFMYVFHMELRGIFMGIGIAQFAGLFTSAAFYMSGIWKKPLIKYDIG